MLWNLSGKVCVSHGQSLCVRLCGVLDGDSCSTRLIYPHIIIEQDSNLARANGSPGSLTCGEYNLENKRGGEAIGIMSLGQVLRYHTTMQNHKQLPFAKGAARLKI